MHIPPFSIIPFLQMSSIPSLQVLIVLQVLIQATQHKDDTHPQAYLFFVLFRVLHQAEALPFSHTTTVPRGYSLHRVPHSCDSPLNVCKTSLNQNVLHLGVPRMHSDPSLAQGKNKVASNHYLHYHFPHGNKFMRMRFFSYLFNSLQSQSFSLPHGQNFPCLQSLHRWSVYHIINSKNIKILG